MKIRPDGRIFLFCPAGRKEAAGQCFAFSDDGKGLRAELQYPVLTAAGTDLVNRFPGGELCPDPGAFP